VSACNEVDVLAPKGRNHVKRIITIMAGFYAVLLAVIFALSWALRAERHRRCLPVPEIPERVRQEISDLASLAAETAADVNAFASRGADEAKSMAQRVAGVFR
jgi:hypothetical protein